MATAIPIFTIGYGSKPLDVFASLLFEHHIAFIIDVRSSPYSRYRPEFSSDSLRSWLKQKQIKYVFMGDQLGGRPQDVDCYDDNGKVDYAILETKPYFTAGIDRLVKAHSLGLRVCIMCSEEKPETCHRSKLIGKVISAKGIEVEHIISHTKTYTQGAVLEMLYGNQTTLFNDPLKSRKTYYKPERRP